LAFDPQRLGLDGVGRGLGKVQQNILDALADAGRWVPTYGLAVMVHASLSPSAVESTRRAMHGLYDRGLIRLRWANLNNHEDACGECGHMEIRRHLVAGLPDTPDDASMFEPLRSELSNRTWVDVGL
jgi:hypothetical protein